MARKRRLFFVVLQPVLRRWGRWRLKGLALAVAIALLCGLTPPGIAIDLPQVPALSAPPAAVSEPSAAGLLRQGQTLYDAGQLDLALQILQQAVVVYAASGDLYGVAVARTNLSLVYQQIGQWPEAQAAITASLAALRQTLTPDRRQTLAMALDVQGQLQLSQGQAEAAIQTWDAAADLYQAIDHQAGFAQSRIRQSEAMQSLGLYRRAIATLTHVTTDLQPQPDSLLQAIALRRLGDALRVVGDLGQSRQLLEQSLAMADRLQQPQAIDAARLSLGNTAYGQGDEPLALQHYEQVVATASDPLQQVQAELNLLRVWLDTRQWASAQAVAAAVASHLDALPPSRTSLYAQVNFARSLLRLEQAGDESAGLPPDAARAIAQRLAATRQTAHELGDRRSEAWAWGNLGQLYETMQQWSQAQDLTQQALGITQAIGAEDMTYLWQWQMGRILAAEQQRQGAIAAYDQAVKTLRSLRRDLVAVNPDVQFSFRASIEPIHRELVALLLQPGSDSSPQDLELARQTIESLQLAELDNFFREACLNAREVQIDAIDRQAAIFYPIILPDRLEVILSLQQQPLIHYAAPMPQAQVKAVARQLQAYLRQASANRRALAPAQDLYDWLIRPAQDALAQSGVRTLVFVLDGVLRNVPMAALHDGSHYLIEQYSLALTPSLQLIEPQALRPQELNVLLGGLSESRSNFAPLPGVITEVAEIKANVPNSYILLNQNFTAAAIQTAISALPFPVVHLATHGEFSSQLENTFLLTWDGRIDINQLHRLLQTSELTRQRPIELLVLSACKTAEGDDRATLGLAGMAVRAGARSTVATLWQLNDEVAPILMETFYRQLAQANVTKAEALRQAQLTLLHNPRYDRPVFWAPVVLVGNWL